jgi:hypothetical protein
MKQSTQPKEAKSMSEVVSEYREYVDVIRPPPEPRASFRDIELLSQTIAIRIWAMRTKHDLATVLAPGYFDEVIECRMHAEDRIEVVASWGQPKAEHATLVVDRVNVKGVPEVSMMLLYERCQ